MQGTCRWAWHGGGIMVLVLGQFCSNIYRVLSVLSCCQAQTLYTANFPNFIGVLKRGGLGCSGSAGGQVYESQALGIYCSHKWVVVPVTVAIAIGNLEVMCAISGVYAPSSICPTVCHCLTVP